MKPRYLDAVYKLLNDKVHGGNMDGPISEIKLHDDQTPPTEEAIQTKLAELHTEYNAQEYARSREAEYPTVQECVHAILDDQLDALQAKRASIKTKYPKGG